MFLCLRRIIDSWLGKRRRRRKVNDVSSMYRYFHFVFSKERAAFPSLDGQITCFHSDSDARLILWFKAIKYFDSRNFSSNCYVCNELKITYPPADKNDNPKNFLANKILNIEEQHFDRSNVSWLVHRTVTGDQLPLPVHPAGGERFFIMHTRPAIAEPPKRHKCTFFLLLPDRTSSIPSAYIEIYLRPCYYQLGAAALSPTHSTAGRGNFWIV